MTHQAGKKLSRLNVTTKSSQQIAITNRNKKYISNRSFSWMALVDGEAEVEGYHVWLIGSLKHIYSMLIGQLSGLPLPTGDQQVPS